MNHIAKFVRPFECCLLALLAFALIGCQSPMSDADMYRMYQSINGPNAQPVISQTPSAQSPAITTQPAAPATNSIVLHEGDVVRVTFPGSPNLNSVQPIRRDGKITLELAGEVNAAGLTPPALEKEILRLCGAQLVTKEVVVSVESSAFPVFVTGAVIRPGKIMSDRPITALQAIMESGGFDYSKANLKSVRVIRQENGEMKNYKLNLKLALEGKEAQPFDLKPADIIYVPEKFTWF